MKGDLVPCNNINDLSDTLNKYCCFLCEWNSHSRGSHYIMKDWLPHQSLEPGMKNVQHLPLVEQDKILLPLLNTKLGLVKNLDTAMGKSSQGFKHLGSEFPSLSNAKIKSGSSLVLRFTNSRTTFLRPHKSRTQCYIQPKSIHTKI